MKRGIIGAAIVLTIAVCVGLVAILLHNRNEDIVESSRYAETSPAVDESELAQIIETVVAAETATEPEVGDFSMNAAVQSVISFILNNEELSKHFTESDIKIKVRDGDTVIYLDNCDRVGYLEKELDAYIIPGDGSEPYDSDGPIALMHWLVNQNDIGEENETEVDPSRADLFNVGDESGAGSGWKPLDLTTYSNVEEWSDFLDSDIEEWYGGDFPQKIKAAYGDYSILTDLTNFLNMNCPYLGTKWQVSLDSDDFAATWWATVDVSKGGVPRSYRFCINPDTRAINIFEAE